ncbi:potassium channel family protein [Shewanella phaeophyticola]|uniref:Ion transporter n=1 Tax=Shewanella phaeophyticola TaxID=2978345 RepID=A0ABT2P4V6_9GAMM|nr:ion transporter [Shewanella sp. KJ10-1]MCT8987687.1 ion transporter [Shewanella sp. KJ10-1]
MFESKRWTLKNIDDPSPFELAMMVLSLVSVVIVLTITFGRLDTETNKVLLYIDSSICVIFLSKFFYGLFKARNKTYYLRHHWIDFVASIPAIEALRFARIFQILRVIRLIRMSRSLLIPLLRQRKQTTLASLLVAMVLILATASVLILLVESAEPNANIQTAEQAIWWALVTISTVGYGDFYPVSTIGHVIGGLVIVSGVSFFGVISGYMASVFVAPDETERQEEQEAKEAHKEQINNKLESALEQMQQNQLQMEQNQQEMLAEITKLRQQLDKH